MDSIRFAKNARDGYIQPNFTGMVIAAYKADFNLLGAAGSFMLRHFESGVATKTSRPVYYYDGMQTGSRFYGQQA